MKSSEPVKFRPSVIASGGSGANQASGLASSDGVGAGLAGVGCGTRCGVFDGAGGAADVLFGVLTGALQEEVSRIKSKRKGRLFKIYLSGKYRFGASKSLYSVWLRAFLPLCLSYLSDAISFYAGLCRTFITHLVIFPLSDSTCHTFVSFRHVFCSAELLFSDPSAFVHLWKQTSVFFELHLKLCCE